MNRNQTGPTGSTMFVFDCYWWVMESRSYVYYFFTRGFVCDIVGHDTVC